MKLLDSGNRHPWHVFTKKDAPFLSGKFYRSGRYIQLREIPWPPFFLLFLKQFFFQVGDML